MKKIVALGLFSFSISIIQPALASLQSGNWLSLEGGRAFGVGASYTDTIAMPDASLPDNYVTSHGQNDWTAGIGAGYQFVRSGTLFPQLADQWFPAYRVGILYNYYSPQTLSGVVNEYQSVAAYNYTLNTYSNTFWLDNQLDLITIHSFTPFVELGIGASLNSSSGYNESPTANNDTPRQASAGFGANTNTAFAYRAGLGVNYRWSETSPVSIGLVYRYTDRGSVKTGNSASYPIGSLNAGYLRSNELSLSIRYFLGGI